MSIATLKYKVEQLIELIQNGGGNSGSGEDTIKSLLEQETNWSYFCYGGTRLPVITNSPNITKNGIDFSNMFNGSSFEVAPTLNTSNGVDFQNMFYNCDNLKTILQLDTSKGETINTIFSGCTNLTTIPTLDIGNATTMNNAFANCDSLEKFPTFINIPTKCSNITSMFNGSGIKSVTNFCIGTDNSSTTLNAVSCFANCSNLETVDTVIFRGKANMTCTTMFQECENLRYIKHIEIIKMATAANMFKNCNALTTIDYIDLGSTNTTAAANGYNNVFYGCEALTTINILKTGMFNANMFQGCPNLTTCILSNEVRVKTNNSLNLSYCPNLTVESLMSFVNNITRNTAGTKYNIVFGEINLAKLTDEQKQILIDKNYTLS